MSTAYKVALDGLVARRAGLSRARVSEVTSAFCEELREQLVSNGEVTIPGLGTLRVFVAKFGREVVLTNGNFKAGSHGSRNVRVEHQVRIYFSKAQRLRAALKESHHGEVRRRRER